MSFITHKGNKNKLSNKGKMRRVIVFFVLVASATFASRLTSVTSGNWNSSAVWGGENPADYDTVEILSTHIVTVTNNTTFNGVLNVWGELAFNNGKMNMNNTSVINLAEGSDIFSQKGNSDQLRMGGSSNKLTGSQISGIVAPRQLTAANLTAGGVEMDVLPVTLTYFSVISASQTVELEWSTEKEENFSHFEIERSVDGANWIYVDYLNGQGNTTEATVYNFTDYSPENGISYYHLKAVDFDGYTEYFGPVLVDNTSDEELNISRNAFGLLITSSAQLSAIQVSDMNGSQVQVNTSSEGFSIPATSGVFIIRAVTADGSVITTKQVIR